MKKLMLLGGIRYLLPAIEAAHKHGYYVITVDYIPDNIAHKYSDEYHNVSIIDKDAVLELALKLKIDGIMSYAVDPGVVSAAYVAEKMGLPFQCSYKAASILQDKSKFRLFLSENGFNVPHAKGYSKENIKDVFEDISVFSWPVIVKPVDSAGSKGVTKVNTPDELDEALEIALDSSHSGTIIVEDFLDVDGYQSSADCFSVDGELIYADFSDQLFDKNAANPYTPSIEVWPSTMKKEHQEYIAKELQRLFSLLGMRTGIYNIESRVCKNGKPYIMEVSPRAGGNRIAELQRIGTGIDIIEAEVCKAVGDDFPKINAPKYRECYVNDIIHSEKSGDYRGIYYTDDFKANYIVDEAIYPEVGDYIESFHGANNAVGSIFLKFKNRKEADYYLKEINRYIRVIVD